VWELFLGSIGQNYPFFLGVPRKFGGGKEVLAIVDRESPACDGNEEAKG